MTHALRQHCGSFLYDNIRREWGTLEASDTVPHDLQTFTGGRMEGGQTAIRVKCPPKEWPLFSAPGLSSLRVLGSKEKGGVLYFTVQAILEGFKWKIDRTYEDFAELQRTLAKTYGMDYPALPSYRKLFGLGFFGSLKPGQVEEMKANLESFVMSAVTSFPIPPTELLKFVEYPFTDVLSVTQALAKFFYVEGEIVLSNDKAVQMSPLQLHCINKRMTLPLASSESGKMKDDFGHLLDFLQNLKKLKIAPPSNEHADIADLDSMTFDLNLMKSLEVLLVECIEIHQLEARYNLPKQLLKLEVRRSFKFLQEVLLVYPPLDVDHSPMSPSMPPLFSSTQALDLSRAMRWEKLQQAIFKLNGIKKIDESVKLLSALERLDLSFNYIEEIEHLMVSGCPRSVARGVAQMFKGCGSMDYEDRSYSALTTVLTRCAGQELPHLRVLDVSHNKITCLVDLHTRLGNITKLGLASNNIVKLNGIQKMFSIQYLDLSNNQISDASEAHYLDPLPCLEKLYLKGNPIASSLSYRAQVFSNLPRFAEQVALDGKPPSTDELVVSISTPTTGHKKVLSRTPDIRPDNKDFEASEELEDMEMGMSTCMTDKLEELRKAGGDEWLSILNAEKAKDDDVVAARSPKAPKKKKKTGTHHKSKSKKSAELAMAPQLEVSQCALSAILEDLLKTVKEESLCSTVNFDVTVLEYRNSSFLTLSPGDLDQLLQNTAMEECTLSVDTFIGKALEIDLAASSTRVTRDLRLIHHIKLHEGKRLAVCLQLPSSRSSSLGGSRWILYSVQNLEDLARLYHTLKTAMTRSRSATPDRPLVDILASIKSDGSKSSLSSAATPSRNLSESDSLHLTETRTASGAGEELSKDQHLPGPAHTEIEPISASLSPDTKDDLNPFSRSDLESSENFESISYEDLPGNGPIQNGTDSPLLTSLTYQQPSTTSDSNFTSVVSDTSVEIPAVVVGGAASSSNDQPRSSSLSGTPEESLSSTVSPKLLTPQHISATPPNVSSPLHASATDTGTKLEQDGESTDGKTNGEAQSNDSPVAERVKLTSHSRERSRDLQSSSKIASTSSSRGASGSNTPRSQRAAQTQSRGTGDSKHSPAVQDTPPLAKTNKPPQNFPSAVIDKLESLVSPELPLASPLYSQDVDQNLDKENNDDNEDELSAGTSIYDPPIPKESSKESSSDADVIKEAVKLSSPEAKDSRVGGRRREKVIVSKPGLDNNNLRMFFKKIIADDTSEVLMTITWGASNLPSAPSCEIEAGTIISDKAVYLLEVLDPKNHRSRPLSWGTDNLPLAKITCCHHTSLRKLTIGIFDQSLTVESFEKGLVKRFVFFPHTYEKLNMFVENLKAAFDAYRMPYTVAAPDQGFISSNTKGLLILNPSSDDMVKLKESLVWSASRAKIGNSVSEVKSDESLSSIMPFDMDLRKVTGESVAKFEIVQYVIVGELSCDVLPVSNGRQHVQSRALILTNETVYLCKEELDSWPHECASIRSPPFPKCSVIDSHPISRIAGIKVCDKSHPIVSHTDSLYEFSITFEELDDIQLSATLSAEWVLCVHDRQYLDQFLGCLTHLSNELQKEKHITVKHTSTRLTIPFTPKAPKSNAVDITHTRKDVNAKVFSNRGANPSFFSSQVLFEFSLYTNYQRLKFFKKHVAQAEFMDSDEVPLSVFLAHCSSSLSEYVEVEVCVIVSNYAIYLLSDVDNIQQWVEMGGVFSFQRRNLLDRKNSNLIRCFYRLWLNEIKQIDVGVFYDSISVTDSKETDSCRFTIHTENPSSTLSFLTALSCVVDLHDTAEEMAMDNLLEDYDLMIDTVPSKTSKPSAEKQHCVEFVYEAEAKIDALKKDMVHKSPAITKSMPWECARGALRVLYQQVMLLVEELRIRDLLTSTFYPHLVFLTNFGMYVCLNEASEKCSPSVMDPSKLSVKKWCHIELIDRIHIVSPSQSQYSCYNVTIYLRTVSRGSFSSQDSNNLSLLVQNSELLGNFLYHFMLMYFEKCGKPISITRD